MGAAEPKREPRTPKANELALRRIEFNDKERLAALEYDPATSGKRELLDGGGREVEGA